jgi:PAS domain S-box-containing protein
MLSDVTIEGIIIHKAGIICDFNPSMLELLRCRPDDIIGKNIREFIHVDDWTLINENVTNNYDNPYEITIVKKDGSQFPAEVEGREFRSHGEVQRVSAVRDITRRKQVDNALRESEARLRAITESAHDGIIMMDPKGLVSYWNPAAERILGYSSDEVIGQNLHHFIAPERYQEAHHAAFPLFQQTGQGGVIGKTLELEALRKDNVEITVQLSLSAVNMQNGWHALGIIRDITDQKQIEEELLKAKELAESATEAKSEFLANMSHEIRTPMNAIIGFLGLIQKTDMTVQQQSYVKKIDVSARSLLGIINDILDFSKIAAGKMEIESIAFRLDDVISNIVDITAVKAAEKNIELLSSIARDVPLALVGDPLRVGQILINLVSNAVKFTDQGHILIKVQLDEKSAARCRIKFSVNDTGIGMAREQIEKLFSPFSQADSSVTRKYGGTGLGLTICKHLVDMMDGEILVESEYGKGSTFTFYITAEIQSEKNETRSQDIEKIRLLKVLIVDDNEMARVIMQDQLGSFGIDALAVASGRAAIEAIKQESADNPYDLVLLDWRMPDMDGIETAKLIMSDKELVLIPKIILVTAYGREEIVRQAERIGISTFLVKPINQSLLYDAIMNIFGVNTTASLARTAKLKTDTNWIVDLHGMQILLAEDNLINQEVATEILRSMGLVVEVANNGQEAADAVAKKQYDAVLMDLQMPIMGGYEATKLIRSDDRNRDLPIIAMTAHAMTGAREDSLAAGMNDYISKPIDPDLLFAVIKKWIKPAVSRHKDIFSPEIMTEQKAAAVELPADMPGIDLESGLKRVNGNRNLYRKLLFDFSKDYSASSNEIRAALEQNKMDQAGMLAHTLKGVAGNLSAYEIQKTAVDLETAFKENDQIKYQDLLSTLDQSMNTLSKALENLSESEKANLLKDDEPISHSEVEPLLQDLYRLISENNLDAENVLTTLQKRVGDSKWEKDMQAIAENLSDFMFDDALIPLQKIAARLNIVLGGE